MAKQRSDTSRYQSNFGGGYVAPAQYLIECLCFLIARADGEKLTNRFWTQDKWQKHFRWQVKPANELLAEFDCEAILDALRDGRCRFVKSFGNKSKLVPIIKEYQTKRDVIKARLMKETTPKTLGDTKAKPRRPMKKKNNLSRLRDLDGETDPTTDQS
jgi:hypothetical protein